MAMNWTKLGRKKILDHFWGRIEYPFPANLWLMLSSTELTDEGLMTGELSEAGYARIEVTAKMADAVLSTGVIANSALITFGPAGEDWPEILGVGLVTSGTIGAGDMISFMPPVTTRIVVEEDDFNIRINQLTFEQK